MVVRSKSLGQRAVGVIYRLRSMRSAFEGRVKGVIDMCSTLLKNLALPLGHWLPQRP